MPVIYENQPLPPVVKCPFCVVTHDAATGSGHIEAFGRHDYPSRPTEVTEVEADFGEPEPDAIVRYRWEADRPYEYRGVSDDDLDNLINSADGIDYIINPETRAHYAEYRRSFAWIYPHDPRWPEWSALVRPDAQEEAD